MSDRRLAQDLRDARARVATLSTWCQGCEALSADGVQVAPRAVCATRWCGVGAARAMPYGEPARHERVTAMERWLHAVAVRLYGRALWQVNDPVGTAPEAAHAAVLMVYDTAIREAA